MSYYLDEHYRPTTATEAMSLGYSTPQEAPIVDFPDRLERMQKLITGLVTAWNSCQNERGKVGELTPEAEAEIYCKARKLALICHTL